MAYPPRPRRVVLVGVRVQLTNRFADLVNLSRTGMLIRANYALRAGSQWPLVFELSGTRVSLAGQVVRCEPVEAVLPGGAVLRNLFAVALMFIGSSRDTQAVLEKVCGLG